MYIIRLIIIYVVVVVVGCFDYNLDVCAYIGKGVLGYGERERESKKERERNNERQQ